MTYLKTRHLPALSIASALLLAACGGGGGSSGGGGISSGGDTTPPTVSFSPSTLTIQSGETATVTLNRFDAGGSTLILSLNCTNGGDYNSAVNRFTAPTVTANTTSVCTANVRDTSNNTASATLTVTVTPLPDDMTDPVLTFSPATVTVQSGETVESTLSVTDDRGIESGPTVTCTNGGSFDISTNRFVPADVTENTESVCTATASDAAGNTGTATLTATMTPAPEATNVTVSGKLTYDRVPFSTSGGGLDYDATFQLPIRQVPVELLDENGTVLDSTVSDDNGDYSFTVLSGQDVRVRVRAEVQKEAPNEIDFKIIDNTSSDALYALQGALSEVPTTNQTRDLNAGSGWGGSSYTTTRAAAPFALLDTIYGAIEDFIAVDDEVDFPAFNVLWSTRNRAQSGSIAAGQIGTSSFTVRNGIPILLILGDDGVDTDEYDVHVVVHEFGHYFENSLSRSDSTGGPHGSSDRLDARIAFGEGWGNALSAMILDDPIYRDSGEAQQGSDIVNQNIENNTHVSTGWYSEASVQTILYDLYDDADDGADTATYGLGPIYGAFTDPAYKDTEAFTTIFSFLEALGNQSGIIASEITAITAAQDINGTTGFGVGETNNGGLPDQLPVYLNLPTNNTAVEFCSVDNFGVFNKHGNRRFLEFDAPSAGNYRFSIQRSSGAASSTPEIVVYKDGVEVGFGSASTANQLTQTIALNAGQHVMEAYSRENLIGASTADVCYSMTLEAL